MELEEHFVYKSKKDRSIITEFLKEDKMDVDAARKRTFEQVVDDEKENTREVFNGTVTKETSGKKVSESVEEQSYSKKAVNGYEETKESSSKKIKSTSVEASSVAELGVISEQEQILQSESSKSKSKSSASLSIEETSTSSFSSKSEKESVSSSAKKTEESILSVSTSVEETKVKANTKSKESAMIVGVSVETEQSASSTSTKESKSSLITSVETEESQERTKGLGLSVETSEGKVEEVPEECRLEPQGLDDGGDVPQDTTDSAPTSLCNDSGFLESSMLESSLFQANESLLESALEDSTVSTTTSGKAEDSAKVSTESDTEVKAKTLKEESQVEESVLSESETSEATSAVQKSEASEAKESKESVTSTTKVTQEKESSHVKEVTEDTSAEATTLTTTAEQLQAKVEEETIKTERTSISQETSRADETTELTSAGDITGLLDEKPDPTTVVEEEVVAVAEDQQEQRARWVDQITTRTETLTMEGEGKKVDELKAKDETAVAVEKQEEQAELSTASMEVSESSVDAESLVGRQASVVDELPVTQDEVAATKLESPGKQEGGHQSRLEVDEGLSAQNVLGLERTPTPIFEDVESSVDSAQQAGVAKEENLAVKAEVDTEETKKAGKAEDELKISAEASVSEGEGLSAPRIASVPDDVSVVLGQAIRLVSQVQGETTYFVGHLLFCRLWCFVFNVSFC